MFHYFKYRNSLKYTGWLNENGMLIFLGRHFLIIVKPLSAILQPLDPSLCYFISAVFKPSNLKVLKFIILIIIVFFLLLLKFRFLHNISKKRDHQTPYRAISFRKYWLL